MSLLIVLLTTLGHASEAIEIATFTSPALEALVAPFEAIAPSLGTCPPTVKRVRATLDQGQVVENALNGFVSDLEVDRDRDYEFGVIAPIPRTEERVRENLLSLGATSSKLDVLATAVWATLAREPSLQLESGTAIYSKRPDIEEEFTLRVIVDRAANEFLLLAVGQCQP